MKRTLYLLALLLALTASCTGVKTISKGLENEAYLQIIGSPYHYPEGVTVTIDNESSFRTKVIKNTSKRPKGKLYAIETGTHTVTVSYDGVVKYSKKIFVSAQETKQIVLP